MDVEKWHAFAVENVLENAFSTTWPGLENLGTTLLIKTTLHFSIPQSAVDHFATARLYEHPHPL